MNIITTPDQPAYQFDNAFAQSSRESFPDDTNSAEGRSSDGVDRSSPSYSLSTVHSGAPLDVIGDDGDQRESKSGLLSSLWKANSKKAEPHRDENRDSNRPASGKSEASGNGLSPKGSWLKKGKPAPVKPLPAAQLPSQNSATAAEVEISSREPSATGKSSWGLTGLLKRTKSDGARTRRTSFEVNQKFLDGGSGLDSLPPVATLTATASVESQLPRDANKGGLQAEGQEPAAPAKDAKLPSARPKSRHQRSKSQSQAENSASWMNRMMACNGPPQVTDDQELVKPSKSSVTLPRPVVFTPNRGLMNAGNLCFFNSLLQALSYTPKLPRALHQAFPNVLEPPAPVEDEPLSRFQPGQKKAAPAASQAKPSPQKTDSPLLKTDAGMETADDGEAPGSASLEVGQAAHTSAVHLGSGHREVPYHQATSEPLRDEGHQGMQEVTSTPDGQNLNESEDSPQALANEANTAQSGPSPPTVAAGAQGRDRATPPAGSSQDGRASDSPSNGSPLSGQAQRATPVPAAAAALELPNGAWTTAPVVPKAEPGRSLPEAVRSFDEGSLEKKPGDTEADRPPAVAEKDRQVWEMSQRARAAALDSPPPPGLLSQALAYIMAQMQRGEDSAVNPFIAVYYAAQRAADLINGAQQDIHEFWMTLKDLLNADATSKAALKLEDLFVGKTVLTLSCKKCSNTVVQKEEFWDLTVSLTVSGKPDRISVDSCLNEFCNPQSKDVKCSKCKEAEEASIAAAAEAKRLQSGSKVSLKETFGALFSNKKEGEGMTEKIAFEKLPPALVIHLKRTQCIPLEGGGIAYQKNDVPVQVNLGLKVGNYASEGLKEELKDDSVTSTDYRLYACIFHIGTLPTRGHYTAACRIGPSDEDWYRFDDEKPPSKIANPVLKGTEKQKGGLLRLDTVDMRDVCLLFYEKYHPGASNPGE